MRCRSAEVLTAVAWTREGPDPKYRDSLKCHSWEVAAPELVFEPVEVCAG